MIVGFLNYVCIWSLYDAYRYYEFLFKITMLRTKLLSRLLMQWYPFQNTQSEGNLVKEPHLSRLGSPKSFSGVCLRKRYEEDTFLKTFKKSLIYAEDINCYSVTCLAGHCPYALSSHVEFPK